MGLTTGCAENVLCAVFVFRGNWLQTLTAVIYSSETMMSVFHVLSRCHCCCANIMLCKEVYDTQNHEVKEKQPHFCVRDIVEVQGKRPVNVEIPL